MIRLFLGLSLSQALRDSLATLQSGVPDVRWVAMENLHLTLRFLGDLHEDQAEDLMAAMEGFSAPAFTLQVKGTGTFQRGQRVPHALWAGVEEHPALTLVQKRTEARARQAGLVAESRRFTPHITLARLRETSLHRLEIWLRQTALYQGPPESVTQVTLFQSHLGRAGADYEALHHWPLETDGSSSS